MTTTVTYRVTLQLPTGANRHDAKQYVLDAVRTWSGSLHPPFAYGEDDEGDPMFNLDRDKVRVTLIAVKIAPKRAPRTRSPKRA